MADLTDPHNVCRQGPRRFRSNRNTTCEESDCGWTWGGGQIWVDGVMEQEIKQAQCWALGQMCREKAVLLSRRACAMGVKLLAMVAVARGGGGSRGAVGPGLGGAVVVRSRYRFGRKLKTGSSAPAALVMAWDGGRHWDGVVSSCCLGEVGGDHVEPLLPELPCTVHSSRPPPRNDDAACAQPASRARD